MNVGFSQNGFSASKILSFQIPSFVTPTKTFLVLSFPVSCVNHQILTSQSWLLELKVGANEFETDRQIHLKTLSVFQYMDNLMRTCIALRIKLKNENNFQLTESYLLGAFAITFSDKIKKEDI